MAKQKKYVTLEKGGVMVATPKTGLKNAVNRTARDVAFGIVEAPKKVANSFRDTKERREGYLTPNKTNRNSSNKGTTGSIKTISKPYYKSSGSMINKNGIKKVPAVKSGTKD